MPGYLLHQGAVVLCAHAGQAQPTMVSPRVKVMGQPVTVLGAPYTVSGCAFPPPPAANGPCIMAQFMMGAVRVKAMGQPVLLQDSQAICTPTGTPVNIVVTQPRVKGM